MITFNKNYLRYTGRYMCPQCGLGSEDLKPEALARVRGQFGSTVKLQCDICFLNFLIRKPAEEEAGAAHA